MDKVLSARVDESTLNRISWLARELGATKKSIIEEAIRAYTREIEARGDSDVLELTCGAWARDEPPDETVVATRAAFRRSLARARP
jgi:hypothetical protein